VNSVNNFSAKLLEAKLSFRPASSDQEKEPKLPEETLSAD